MGTTVILAVMHIFFGLSLNPTTTQLHIKSKEEIKLHEAIRSELSPLAHMRCTGIIYTRIIWVVWEKKLVERRWALATESWGDTNMLVQVEKLKASGKPEMSTP